MVSRRFLHETWDVERSAQRFRELIIYIAMRKPDGFHQSKTRPDIWVARTKIVITGPDIVLSHRVLYRINEAERSVTLLWVEFTDPETDDDWGDEPF